MEHNYLRCPTCGHTDMVQKVSTIVEGGTTYGTAHSVGSAYAIGGGFAVGSSRTSSFHQTVVSQKLDFPEHSYKRLIQLLCASLFLELFFRPIDGSPTITVIAFWILLAFILTAGPYVIYRKITDRPKRQYAIDVWRRLFYCRRDDTIFAPDDPTLRAPADYMRNLLNY